MERRLAGVDERNAEEEVGIVAYAKRVTPLDNYNIIVKFDTGETKIYNCYPLLNIPLFAKLKNKDFFMTAHIDETGLVCWDNATDIPPEELYNNSVEIAAR